jgi:hypothetical protein
MGPIAAFRNPVPVVSRLKLAFSNGNFSKKQPVNPKAHATAPGGIGRSPDFT